MDTTVVGSEVAAKAKQVDFICNGNEAAAKAIVHCGYDGEGYYPITPSSEVGEEVSKAIARGEADINFVVGTSELAAISICAGMAMAGGRVVDVTSSQGLMLKLEELPALSGLGLPMVLNLSTREVSAPLNIKNGHSDLAFTLGAGWIILMAPTVQAVYDMNIIALKVAEAVNLPVIVAYDGFHTSHANRRIKVFEDPEVVREWIGPHPFPEMLHKRNGRLSILDVERPHTFGPYMNDDLINNKVQLELKMEKAYEVLSEIFKSFAELSGRRYWFVDQYGDKNAERCLVALNTAGETAKDAVDHLAKQGQKVNLVMPLVLRPWPEKEIVEALGNAKKIVVAERVSQYGANNYLANEIGAALQRRGNNATIIQRTYGLGGIVFTRQDALNLYELAEKWPNVDDPNERRIKWYYGAWEGDPNYQPEDLIEPVKGDECVLNAGQERVNLRELSKMPHRIDKHSACPGCGIFTNLDLFLRGIDGDVILIFNTGCGMVVTTGFPRTSFKVPYFHNLFHNGASTATGIVEMISRFKRQGKLDKDVTVIVVTGDGGDDIGMDQVIAAALRNDPFIMLEYDNKGYMNTGSQLCYTGIKGQISSNAPIGPKASGKKNHHKDIIEILRGTFAPYLFQAAESNPADMIRKARKAQQTVRNGGFAFGKVFSTCPLNWGMPETNGPKAVKAAVDACLHPLYEVDHGKTILNYDPEKLGRKIPVVEAFKLMGRAFAHLTKPEYKWLADDIQTEVDRRWQRLKAMAEHPLL